MIIIEAYKYSIKNSLLINPVAENKKRLLANMSLRNKTLLTKRKNSSKAADNNVKAMTLDIMNTEFIINFLDNLIMNKFRILIIDEEFFQEEQNLLKIFTEFLVEFKEIKFKINLYEEDDSNINEENLVGGETINKETFVSAFSDRFNLDSHESKPQNNSVIANNNNKIDNMNNNLGNDLTNPNFQLIIIDASNTFINNRGFIKAILPLAQKSPFLEKHESNWEESLPGNHNYYFSHNVFYYDPLRYVFPFAVKNFKENIVFKLYGNKIKGRLDWFYPFVILESVLDRLGNKQIDKELKKVLYT